MDVQTTLCQRFGADYYPCMPHMKLGVAMATIGRQPVNGLRHLPEEGTTGWYVWCGEQFSSAADVFQPVHIAHLDEILPLIVPYLGLPAGWRFQFALNHEDVWFDAGLLLET